ncbi:esterase/lipase family protein [Lysobacter silvisoli]|uniref:Alpha/beta hydrolase n=1 Tax=Lysobacter silvisoli TaxID=2293254 RepID=A0A371K4B8_9GAMM|nr:alpha/beta hydrolase [Lysobacter silvisoli]RDZ28779.1 alpha/beta hydrolase [Lysobacter silvisoli]
MPSSRSAIRPRPASNGDDLRGVNRLTIDAITGVTDLVEAMHANISRLPGVLGTVAAGPAPGIAGFVYRSVRGATRLVGDGLDLAFARAAPLLDVVRPPPQREAMVAAANGVLGDHLDASRNPLAIPMRLRHGGQALTLRRRELAAALPDAGGKILVLVHGLCMNDLQWRYGDHDHGAALARDLGYTPLYLHYNSGRHISVNGREFSRLLEQLLQRWPVPVERLAILGHSMGGLVARSACVAAQQERLDWLAHLDRMIFLGTPHQGAPLERAGSWIDAMIGLSPYTAPFARLGKIRSAGIQDLRHGNVRDEDWEDADADGRADGRQPSPLPPGVRSYAVAASTASAARDDAAVLPKGDGLVPVASALGRHPDRAYDLRMPKTRQHIAYGVNHLELLGDAGVYRQLLRWLG